MTKHSFIVSLFLLATSNALACNPGQGTGQCGFYDATGRWVATRAEYDASFQQQSRTTYTPPSPPPPPRIVMLPDRFGAIVIGETTFASTYNMNSKREARQKALRECQPEKKQPCRIFTEYRNSCVSLAQGRDKKRGYLVAEFADKRGQASRKAMDKCSAQYDNCPIIIEEECSIAEPPR